MCGGLDLGYGVDGISHASGTNDFKKYTIGKNEMQGFHRVKGFDGNYIYSSPLFDIYREWIERRIASGTKVEYINASVGGSYIVGMKHKKFEEIEFN